LAIPGLLAAQPNLSRIKSIDLFNTFCLLCIYSSDWCAKEKECRDSEGNRLRSSLKFSVGEDGPDGREEEGWRL